MAIWMDTWGRPILHNVAAAAICGAAVFVGGKAASMTPALQPYAPFSYVMGALVCLLLAVLVMSDLPRFRKAGGGPASPPDDQAKLQEHLKALSGAMEGMERRLRGEFDGWKEHVRSEDESLRMYLQVLEGKLGDLKGEIRGHQHSFLAVYHRERMLALAKILNEKSLELGKPPAEGKVMNEDEWEEWKRESLQWEASASEWSKWAVFYLGHEPMNDIKRINSEGLDENWGVKAHQFPDPEGLRIYKTFRIYVRNWANIRDVVHHKVRRIAFEGAAA